MIWRVADVKTLDSTLTRSECEDILMRLEAKADCSIGISWDVIQFTIDWYKQERRKE